MSSDIISTQSLAYEVRSAVIYHSRANLDQCTAFTTTNRYRARLLE